MQSKDWESSSSEKTSILHDSTIVSPLLTKWRNDPDYVDDMGYPKPLAIYGDGPSIASLLKLVMSDANSMEEMSPPELANYLTFGGVTKYTEDGLVKPVRAWFRTNKDPIVAARNSLSYINNFASTAHRNTTNSRNGLPLFLATGRNFPESRLPVIRALVESDGLTLLESLDSLIDTEKSKAMSDEKKINVSVGVYLTAK